MKTIMRIPRESWYSIQKSVNDRLSKMSIEEIKKIRKRFN